MSVDVYMPPQMRQKQLRLHPYLLTTPSIKLKLEYASGHRTTSFSEIVHGASADVRTQARHRAILVLIHHQVVHVEIQHVRVPHPETYSK